MTDPHTPETHANPECVPIQGQEVSRIRCGRVVTLVIAVERAAAGQAGESMGLIGLYVEREDFRLERRKVATMRQRAARALGASVHRAAAIAGQVDAGEDLAAAIRQHPAPPSRREREAAALAGPSGTSHTATAAPPSRAERDAAALVRPPGTPPASWSAATRETAQDAPSKASDEVCHAAPEENAR
jgi:hypothetical protein